MFCCNMWSKTILCGENEWEEPDAGEEIYQEHDARLLNMISSFSR